MPTVQSQHASQQVCRAPYAFINLDKYWPSSILKTSLDWFTQISTISHFLTAYRLYFGHFILEIMSEVIFLKLCLLLIV